MLIQILLRVWLDTRQAQYLVRNNGLLKWLCSVFVASLAVPHWLFLGETNIAVHKRQI